MSLILDALKRAENERRDLLSAFTAAPPPGTDVRLAGRRRSWLIGIILLLVMAAVAGLYLFKSRTPARSQTSHDPVATSGLPAPETQLVAPQATAVAAPSVIPGTEGMASLDELTLANPGPASAAVPVTQPAKPVAAQGGAAKLAQDEPAQAAGLASTDADANRTETEAPANKSSEPDAIETTPTKPVPPALTQAVPLRKFREMTPEYRSDFPALVVEVHVYDDNPARRWTLINGRRYKAGERLAEGPMLTAIAPDGLVLDFRGEKLLYPVKR